jgi:DNA-binding NarL/FixJ family response regulator
MPKTRVVLADDHVLVAHGMAELLRDAVDLVAVVHDGRALVEAVEKFRPDVIVTDISMPNLNGLDAIRQIRLRNTHTQVVVLSVHTEPQMAVSAFRAGARGYVPKLAPPEEFLTAIQEVANGRAYVSPGIAKDLLEVLLEAAQTGSDNSPELTPRQREVLQLIAEGRTMKEVAHVLHISRRTAESHKYDIMNALGIDTTAGLVQYAFRNKLIE